MHDVQKHKDLAPVGREELQIRLATGIAGQVIDGIPLPQKPILQFKAVPEYGRHGGGEEVEKFGVVESISGMPIWAAPAAAAVASASSRLKGAWSSLRHHHRREDAEPGQVRI